MGLRLFVGLILLISCKPQNHRHAGFADSYTVNQLIYEDAFDRADTSDWIAESEGTYQLAENIFGGALHLDVSSGITVWNRNLFKGNLMFEFEAAVVSTGVNDRVSDLNCFWMATDPGFPDNFFERSSWRRGVFWNYYSLNLYYVGFGGHNNTKTRMRKYDVAAIPPPVIKEYVDPDHLIISNKMNLIQIVCLGSTVAYSINGKEVFNFEDADPYQEGYFGFRTVDSYMKIESFRVYSLTKRPQ